MDPKMDHEAIQQINRPHSLLFKSYLLHSVLWGPAFFMPLIWKFFRYQTMRYQFDEEGVTMMWGRFSRQEISVTYRTIQDIHLRSDVIERWLGLARIEIQTASGEAKAELVLEGLLEFEQIRDYLYRRMQLAKRPESKSEIGQTAVATETLSADMISQLTSGLQAVTAELRAVREALNGREAEEVTHE